MEKLLKLMKTKKNSIGHIAIPKYIIKMENMTLEVYSQIFKIIKLKKEIVLSVLVLLKASFKLHSMIYEISI